MKDISPDDELGKGRRFLVLYEKTPTDSNTVLMTTFDFEYIFQKYCKMMEEMGNIKCDKCGYYSNDQGNCPNCDNKIIKKE